MSLKISNRYSIRPEEIGYQAIRATGPGGQNVNKTASAIHLRFDIRASSLPEVWQERLLQLGDQRISNAGVIVIKANRHRTRELNREDARQRLRELILGVVEIPKKRRPTRPSRRAKQRRLDAKGRRSHTKALRGKVY
jgi:ribosome-associated protein